MNLNDKIFEAYTNHIKVKLSIYKNQNVINLIGFVNNINVGKKYITFLSKTQKFKLARSGLTAFLYKKIVYYLFFIKGKIL